MVKWLVCQALVGLLSFGSVVQACTPAGPDPIEPSDLSGYVLDWADEFDVPGAPDPKKWAFEEGFIRNQEIQWYQRENAWCEGGCLIVEARTEHKENPNYVAGSTNWKTARHCL